MKTVGKRALAQLLLGAATAGLAVAVTAGAASASSAAVDEPPPDKNMIQVTNPPGSP